MVKGGLNALYLSGWQVAGDNNLASHTYPDQSLYPSNSVPAVVKRLNNALMRADQIDALEGKSDTDWFVPIVADAEAGFGGAIHAFELMRGMIEAGAAGVHYEDQLSSAKEVRPHGRQGSHSHQHVRTHPQRREARRRRPGRAHHPLRTDGRPGRYAAHQRHRRSR